MSTRKTILIITVYNSENSGSYLQSYALYNILSKNKYKVYFLKRDTKNTSHSIRRHVIASFKCCLKLDIKNLINIWHTYIAFDEAQLKLPIYNIKRNNTPDIVIIGSDTLWNFQTPYFASMAKIFHGLDFNDKKILTYAISAANTSIEKYKETISPFKKRINISHYLVRDVHTKELVEKVHNKPAELVCDPTLLLTKSDYRSLEKKIIIKPYILLYFFEYIPKQYYDKIISYAKLKNLKIVSFGSNRFWCDKSIIASPSGMISYFSNAECIITDTFHGSAFSIIYEKPFAVFNEGKNKVIELLKIYNLENHLFTDFNNLEKTLMQSNNVHSSGLYDKIRNNSINILQKAIKE